MKSGEIIGRYTELLCLKKYSGHTQESYLHQLHLFLDYFWPTNVSNLTSNDLLKYINYLRTEKKFSYSCLKQAHAAIHFLYKNVFEKEIDLHFLTKMKKPASLPVILSIQEVKQVIESTNNLKHKTIISTIYSCGLRISEAVNLKISHINFSTMHIKIVNAKNKGYRYVMLSEELLNLFDLYFKKYRPCKYLFEGKNGGQYSARSIQEIFSKAVEKAGISKRVTVGTLRHSFAAHLIDNGTDVHLVQELLGHKHLSTTLMYTYIHPLSIQNIKSPFDLIMKNTYAFHSLVGTFGLLSVSDCIDFSSSINSSLLSILNTNLLDVFLIP